MTRGALLALGFLAACDEPPDQRLAIVDQPRVLAIVAEPAEAEPGDDVTLHAIVGGPDGPIAEPPTWAYCLAPKPPTEDNAVATGCVTGADGSLAPLGTATEVTGALPADGCLRFGPDTPPGGFRPRDPDGTGGYYQPVRLDLAADGADLLAFGLPRITCNLPTAPSDIALDYRARYVANANPALTEVRVGDASGEVPADTDVTLVARWDAAAAETYLYFDPAARVLVDRREAMRVSWFATGGAIDVDATAIGETDLATSATATWHTPAAAGSAWLWFVLRDSRGGTSAHSVNVTVR